MNDRSLSKFMSLVLRHAPERYGLAPNDEGFVPLEELVVVASAQPGAGRVTEEDLRRVVRESDKQRFEIVKGRMRARYGHSIEQRIVYPPVEPPALLYHGTARHALAAIRRDGLRAMSRQYVHCSVEPELALTVGRRHTREPVLLTIRAAEAHAAGVPFYNPEPRIFLADEIPAAYLDEP